MTEERQAEYIKGKYGRWGLDRCGVLFLFLVCKCKHAVSLVYKYEQY